MMRYPRILFYAVNGLGVGHVTRLLAIARQVRTSRPSTEILFLTSSEADDMIYREGFAAFKVPSKTLRQEGRLRSGTYAQVVELAAWNIVAGFRPHVMVVDTFPAGAIQELLPILRWEARKVFVFRAQKAEKAADPFFQKSLAFYDLAVIPHPEGEEAIPLPDGLKSVWTGPILIRSREEMLSPEAARQRLGLPEGKTTAYISFGGGGDREIEEALGYVLKAASELPGLHLAVALGPLYRGLGPSSADMTRIVNYYPISECFPAFDFAVSAAGYNTTMELLHAGIPTIFIPFDRAYDDQAARARRIAEGGAGLRWKGSAPETLTDLLGQMLDPRLRAKIKGQAVKMVSQNGAKRAAEAIVEFLG
ncbi:MAG: UDP-glucosyltransferase [Armatimonadetes bacterium]|nr:UDP-glucosyltransferase [Armatimonadota bacterium]